MGREDEESMDTDTMVESTVGGARVELLLKLSVWDPGTD